MEVLPVLDLLNGVVVRGVAGRRSEYRPLQTRLTTSCQPRDVARAIRSEFGLTRLYVADLDAIMHRCPNWDVYRQLLDDGFHLLVDAGIRTVEESLTIQAIGAEPIVGLESCPSPQVLADIVSADPRGITFSLDLKDGHPLLAVDTTGWSPPPLEIARQAVACGVTRMIVLDLADVGTSTGGQSEILCRSILTAFPELTLTCGGGVRGIDDLRRLRLAGVGRVLVASALHDGRLSSDDVASVCGE